MKRFPKFSRMRATKSYSLFLALVIVLGLWSCKKWDDHIAVNTPSLNENLFEYISKQGDLTKFSEYLVKTGLDKEISSSKNYTVWAPTNNALQAVAPDVINDTARLKAYLLNHISGQLFYSRNTIDSLRVPMMNGKRVFFLNKKLDDANVTQPDVTVRNGVLHVIDKVVAPLPNMWEYIESTKATNNQNAYITTLNYESQDPKLAQVDSINPLTGEVVYKPNTGIVRINTFQSKVYDVSNEDSLYTYVLLTNTAFTTEHDKQKPFFKSPDATITTSNASWNVVKDLAIKGLYAPNQLPATLMSKFNVRIPLSTASIVETKRVSNGIVYIVNAVATDMVEKIPDVIIQGEKPDRFSSNSDTRISRTFYRNRINPLTGVAFNDIYLNLGSGGVNNYVDYSTNELFTTKYKVYWVALNDKVISGQGDDTYGTDSTLQQVLHIGADTSNPFKPAFTVQAGVKPYTYTEVFLGEYTNADYNFLLAHPVRLPSGSVYTFNPATRRLRLQAPATASTGIPANLTLDYIKLVPTR